MKQIFLILMLLAGITINLNAEKLKNLTHSCEQSEFDKCSELAHIYDSGNKNVEKNPLKALELFTKACSGGNGEGCFYLSFKYSIGSSYIKKDEDKANSLIIKAERIWKNKCSKGDAENCRWLGSFYALNAIDYDDTSNHFNARKYLNKACDGGNAKGCFMLGNIYMNGLGVRSDYSAAKILFKKACNNGSKKGCVNYENNQNECDILAADPKDRSKPPGIKGVTFDNIDFKEAIESCTQSVKDFPNIARYKYQLGVAYTKGEGSLDGFEWLKKSAYQGHYIAQYYTATVYDFNEELMDRKKAFKWYLSAAKQGHTQSQMKVAYTYASETENYGVEKSDKKVYKWFLKAARGGHAFAQESVAGLYIAGKGVDENYKKGFYWFRKSAEQGNLKSQLFVAGEYYLGERIEKNNKKFLFWITKAAKQGNIFAQHQVGFQYYLGERVEKNYKKSFEWYMKAAKQGDMDSQDSIGDAYYDGRGTKKNYKKSFEWRMKASIQGKVFSQSALALMYYDGKGVKRNYIKAYAWLNQALSGDMHPEARIRYEKIFNIIEKSMTPNQIFIAQEYDPLSERKKEKSHTDKVVPFNIYTGTGFFVNQSAVVTNNHVVKECKNIEVVKGDQRIDAHILVSDSRNDLAILKTKNANSNFLYFRADRNIRIGEEIIVLGYPFGKLLGTGVKLTTGNISALTGLVDDVTSIQITAPVQPGNSGGPLLDNSGNLVGIVVARLEKDLSGNIAQNVNIAIKSNILKMLLSTNGIDYSMSVLKDKKEVVDIADDTKKSVVQVVCYK